ncbi:MAG: hypothetical protein M9894_13795 [Planctomycetes bacterium]|nr:hypothetical protein [Planctomycetota bacterium]
MSALVLTLADDPAAADDALGAIAADARFTLGPREGPRRVALVMDTPDRDADQAAHDWLLARPGVAFVDVVLVYLDPVPTETR